MGDHQATEGPELLDWLGLRLIKGVGSVTFARLLEAFGSPGRALSAPLGRLEAVPGVGPQVAQAIAERRWSRQPDEELARLEQLGARAITLGHPEYPPLLRQIYAAPPVLFLRGELTGCHEGGVAVVGSRSYSPYGRRVAGDLGRDLGRAGLSIISGLARGVDAAAHQGALQAGGHTVGVMGCGLDVAYPPEHMELMNQMAAQGAVISEFPLGTPPAAGNFPVRNRVISGLSRAVVVVEASLRSGSLITARHALDQGREVWAVPGPVGSPGSQGCHELIRQGAHLLNSAADLLEEGAMMPPSRSEPAAPPPADLPPAAAELLELVGPEPVHVDQLVRRSGLKAEQVTVLLVHLELSGLVSQQAGNHYVRS